MATSAGFPLLSSSSSLVLFNDAVLFEVFEESGGALAQLTRRAFLASPSPAALAGQAGRREAARPAGRATILLET